MVCWHFYQTPFDIKWKFPTWFEFVRIAQCHFYVYKILKKNATYIAIHLHISQERVFHDLATWTYSALVGYLAQKAAR